MYHEMIPIGIQKCCTMLQINCFDVRERLRSEFCCLILFWPLGSYSGLFLKSSKLLLRSQHYGLQSTWTGIRGISRTELRTFIGKQRWYYSFRRKAGTSCCFVGVQLLVPGQPTLGHVGVIMKYSALEVRFLTVS